MTQKPDRRPARNPVARNQRRILWRTRLLLPLATALAWAPAFAQERGVHREVYSGLASSALESLTNDTSFPHLPASSGLVTGFFEMPRDFDEHYGQRVRALLVPPLTGTYVFWIAADDAGLLYLSSDESPGNKTAIAWNLKSVGPRAWHSQATQESTNVFLEASRRYYIEALQSAGTGDDALSVGWKLPGGILEQPIPDLRLQPFGRPATEAPVLVESPASVSVPENGPASFRVVVNNLDEVFYQWQRNEVDVPGARCATYRLPAASFADHGARFRCVVSNALGLAISAEAALNVLADSARPQLAGAGNLTSNTVQVLFSEPVDPFTARNIAHYALTPGAAVLAAAIPGSAHVVVLTTTPLTPGTDYTLSVANVRDRATAGNVIQAGTQRTFTARVKGVYREVFGGIPGRLVSDLTGHPTFPDQPTGAELFTAGFAIGRQGANNYGQRLRALVTAPATGDYTFWLAADDTAVLLLGTNELAAGARPIATVTTEASVSAMQWDVQPGQRSAPVSLVAGRQYYLEARMKAGVSVEAPPDHLAVRWQMPGGAIEEPIPVVRLAPSGMSLPRVTVQPTNMVADEGAAALFTVAVGNLERVGFQWQQDGLPVPNATNATHVHAPVRASDHGSTFRCLLANALGATSSVSVLLSVRADRTPPAMTQILNQGSNRLVIQFSEAIEEASAVDPANYRIPGVSLSAPLLSADGRSVALATSPLSLGSLYTLTVNRLRDRAAAPNVVATNSSWSFLAAEFFPQDIGAPGPGAIEFIDGGLNLTAGDGDAGGTNDQFSFSSRPVRGDFDVKVRLQGLEFADTWSAAGLMVRHTLAPDSRYAAVFATPSVAGSFFQCRSNAGGLPGVSGSFPVNPSHTWLRLQRAGGDRFTGFASLDGQTWSELGSALLALPATLHLGFVVDSQDPARTVQAQFRDFGNATGDRVGPLSSPVEPPGPSSRRTGLVLSEIMTHPVPRQDGRELRFVELFNASPVLEDLGGMQLSGEFNYSFPAGTLLPGGACLVVARNPDDVRAVHGIANVVGPCTGGPAGGAGMLRLGDPSGAVLFEVSFGRGPGWPVAAGGAGHSWVLARPSLGERHADAWAASDRLGGSPGQLEGVSFDGLRPVRINELLAHTASPAQDYVELHNTGVTPVNLSGCWLSDHPFVRKFRIPDGTLLGPTGYVHFTGTTLGFGLEASGGSVYLVHSNLSRVSDAVTFGGQAPGVPLGCPPGGSPGMSRLAAATPGARNAAVRSETVVINEIMFQPVSGDANDEYIELHNRGGSPVSLGSWRLTAGGDFTFGAGAVIPANGYLVVARNAARLLSLYTNLNSGNTLGNYAGALDDAGGTIALAMPGSTVGTNLDGTLLTNQFMVVVSEVTYGARGIRGPWSNGGGSSLELIDPRSPVRLPGNWADSDETAKGAWITLSASGTLDHASGVSSLNNALQIFLAGPGECLVDSVSVSIEGGGNLVPNGEFESAGLNLWRLEGSHARSRLASPGASGLNSLHLIASHGGDSVANHVTTSLSLPYTTNVSGTISARVKWLRGRPEILLRLRGNHLDLAGAMSIPRQLGTPGARNSRHRANAAPSVTEVTHLPVLPAVLQPVVVTARVQDPDGVALVELVHRLDAFGDPATILMRDDGTGPDAVARDGVYSAQLPGQAGDALVAFYVQATDSLAAVARFPASAPEREALVRFGETPPPGAFGAYRFWLTRASYDQWVYGRRLGTEGFPGTFVGSGHRVIHDATARFAASPLEADELDTPDGAPCDYVVELPPDEPFLGATRLALELPGKLGRDATAQLEQTAHGMARQMGLRSLHRRPVHFFLNGVRRGLIYEDAQEVGGEGLTALAPAGAGDLHEVRDAVESGDDLSIRRTASASLQEFLTTGGVRKQARYRATFTKPETAPAPFDFGRFHALVDELNDAGPGVDPALSSTVDLAQWAKVFALERLWNNLDFYANQPTPADSGAKGCYLWKSEAGLWQWLSGDVDLCFSGPPIGTLFRFSDPPISNLFARPAVGRIYWQTLEDAANGPWTAARAHPGIDARYRAYVASGIAVGLPTSLKNFIAARRDYVLEQIAGLRAGFSLTSHEGGHVTNDSPVLTLSGTGPISARTLRINGMIQPAVWTSLTNWTLLLALTRPVSELRIEAFDAEGRPLPGGTVTLTVHYSGPLDRPEDSLGISEIQARPAVSNASYIEIHNRSFHTPFSLLQCRLEADGLSFEFTADTLIQPQESLVVVKNVAAFQSAHGTGVRPVGVFAGDLNPEGATLALRRRTEDGLDTVLSRVRFEARAPWPGLTHRGVALQRIDATQDPARVSNWDDGSAWRHYSFTGRPVSTTSPRFFLWLDGAGEVYLDDLRLVLGSVPAAGSNYLRNGSFESPLASPWLTTGSPGSSSADSTQAQAGSNSLRLVFTKAGSATICLYQDLPSGVTLSGSSNYTISFWYRPRIGAGSGTNLTVRLASSSGSSTASSTVLPLGAVTATPGEMNWVAGSIAPYPPLWINEVQPWNTLGLRDHTGSVQPWIELYNGGTHAVSLDGCFLSRGYSNLQQWAFPPGTLLAPGEFRVVFADGQPHLSSGAELHTSFRLDAAHGSIALSRGRQILDYLNYTNLTPDLSVGAWPDGQPFERRISRHPTPGAANLGTNDVAPVLAPIPDQDISEGALLAIRCVATDEGPGPLRYALVGAAPAGVQLDATTGQFTWTPGESQDGLHSIAIEVTDGGSPPLRDVQTFAVHVREVNTAPAFGPIAPVRLDPGVPLRFFIPATDSDLPAQTLTFELISGPAGAFLDPDGWFLWTPGLDDAGTTNPVVVRATDNGLPPFDVLRTFQIEVNGGDACPGLKADVAPRLAGNQGVTVADWVLVGRFAAGLSDVSNACELARADCAPRPCGNGVVGISDWVQAGRFAAGLDPVVSVEACNPGGGGFAPAGAFPAFRPAGQPLRTVIATNLTLAVGRTNRLQVLLLAEGDEAGLTFSLSFDPQLLNFTSAEVGTGAAGAILHINTNQLALGRIGLAMALPIGTAFVPGLQGVAEIGFTAKDAATKGTTPVSFVDEPIRREISDLEAQIAPAGYQGGTILIRSEPELAFERIQLLEGGRVRLDLAGALGIWELQGAMGGGRWAPIARLTNESGRCHFIDPGTTNLSHRLYRAVRPAP